MRNEHLAEVLQTRVNQLEARINEQHAALRERIEAVQYEQVGLAAAVLARIDAHEDYHRRNEHRWGALKLAGRYPFRFAALARTISIVGSSLLPGISGWILRHIPWVAGLMGG